MLTICQAQFYVLCQSATHALTLLFSHVLTSQVICPHFLMNLDLDSNIILSSIIPVVILRDFNIYIED